MTFRWLTDDEIETLVNPDMPRHGWAQLNLLTSRVMGAFDDTGVLIETLSLQLYPMVGPLLRHDHAHRDSGSTSRELANQMDLYLKENGARGWIAIADHPITERLCERYGMHRVGFPVFMTVGPVAEEVH